MKKISDTGIYPPCTFGGQDARWHHPEPLRTRQLFLHPKTPQECNAKRNFIVELAKWESSLNPRVIEKARQDILKATGFYIEVKEELKQYLHQKLDRLWEEGIGGADFFIAAIGSAIEIFGKYETVMDYEGNIIRAERFLEDVRKFATDYAVRKILHNGFVETITDLTRFYVLYRWNYGAMAVDFDEARKLAQACGIDLTEEWGGKGFIKKQKEFIHVLGHQDRQCEDLKDSTDLIDVLHYMLWLWEKDKLNDMLDKLETSGYGKKEAFFRIAQAISETLPIDNKEKKLLDGFLVGKERLIRELQEKRESQMRLFS